MTTTSMSRTESRTASHSASTAGSVQSPVDLRSASLVDELAGAYAERLSCIRRAASAEELAANARRISRLEERCRADVRRARQPHTELRLDPALYLG